MTEQLPRAHLSGEFAKRERSWPLVAEFMAGLPAGTPRIPQTIPVSIDLPDHSKYRAPLQRVFSPKAMQALEAEIRALSNQLIDAVIARKQCEFMSDIAEPLPVQIFS